ncbi:astacin [Folsomia candida]|uniref:Metalloendopeptidase n=1 Tax=Folsomia candida TaxID=158441 RepID=A0A226EV59_FOLCA|nr:astacin [Folsomia candida]OXA60964.1 Meprin A subunit beta [Folsomia candida]
MINVKVVVCLLLSLCAVAWSTPVVRPLPPTKPTSNDTAAISPFRNPVFDMKLTPEQMRSGVIDERYRWRNGFIVHPDRGFNQNEYSVINDALYELSQHLCIQVLMWPQDSNPTGDYVEIMRGGSGSGCWAWVGRLGGRQDLNLQFDGCIYKHIVQHECIHALGYYHEQSRPDRDDHVNILWNNVIPDTSHNFDKMDDTTTFGVPYDTRSIMHYDSYAFSSNGQPTILAKDGSTVGGNSITGNDIAKLQRMYNC